MSKRFFIGAAIFAVAFLGFLFGGIVHPPGSFVINSLGVDVAGQPAGVDFSQFWKVWHVVTNEYYGREKLDSRAMVYGAIKGMVQATGDKYGEFFTPKETKDFLDAISGSFDGIGAEIGTKDKQIVIVAPLKGTPAEKAGLKSQDIIAKIDDTSTQGMTLEQAVSLIKGTRGTKVRLTIIRSGVSDPLQVTITRAHIEVPSVEGKILQDDMGYIDISSFTEITPDAFHKEVKQLASQGMKRLVLDLRNDPGGVLNSAVEVASVFVGPGKVVAIEKKPDGDSTPHKTVGEALIPNMPVVVLVNGGSASAAEILAGALRDLKGVQLVGEQTFGKGSVQSYSEFNNGASLKVTTAHWFTPDEYSIEGDGLKPDIVVKNDSKNTKDAQLSAAEELLKKMNPTP